MTNNGDPDQRRRTVATAETALATGAAVDSLRTPEFPEGLANSHE
jgi:hypothetical protein